MQPFIKYALLIFSVVIALFSITLFASRNQTSPSQLEILRLDDCQLPCWIGIIPGQTTIEQAQTRVKSTYSYKDNYEYSLHHNPYDDRDWITIKAMKSDTFLHISFDWDDPSTIDTENMVVSQITIIATGEPNLTWGDWCNVIGEPEALSITWGNHYAAPNALNFEKDIRLTLDNDNFAVDSPYIPAATLDIYDHLDKVYNQKYVVPWNGWRSSDKDKLIALMQP